MVKIGRKYIYPSHGCQHLVVPALVLYYQIQCFITKIHYCSLGGNFYLFHFLLSLSLLGLLFCTSQMANVTFIKAKFQFDKQLTELFIEPTNLDVCNNLEVSFCSIFFLVFLGVLSNI